VLFHFVLAESVLSEIVSSEFIMKSLIEGFSLLEMLVVVSILATVAGIGMQAYGNTKFDTEVKLSIVELQNIAKAVQRFKHDTGYYPKQGPFNLDLIDRVKGEVSISLLPSASGSPAATQTDWFDSPANFYQLVIEPVNESGDSVMAWDIETGKGWHGPYLSSVKLSYVDLSNDLKPYGLGDYSDEAGFAGVLKNIPSLYDGLGHHRPVTVSAGFDTDGLLVDWRNVASNSSNYISDKHEMGRPGSPYLLFIHDIDPLGDSWPLPKLVAVGANGEFDGTPGDYQDTNGVTRFSREDWCTGAVDDVVVCL